MIKNILLYLCLSLGLVFPVYAEENAPAEETQPIEQVEENVADTQETAANPEQEQNAILENADMSLNKEKKPEFVVEHKVEKDIQTLPTCEDENLQKNTYEYVKNYFAASKNTGALHRRQRYFILNNLNKFEEQNIADYKTPETSPISDMIAHIKVNRGVIEENMRLCKNKSENQYAGKVYLLIYPEDKDNYRVNVINLARELSEQNKTTFTYAR